MYWIKKILRVWLTLCQSCYCILALKKLFFVWQKRGLEKHHSTQKKRLQLMCVYSMLKFFEFARLERGTASQVRRLRAPHITL